MKIASAMKALPMPREWLKARPYGGAALLLFVLLIFPLVGPSYILSLLIEVLIFGIFAMSLDLLMGYTGPVSFGHAAFFGLGAYLVGFISKGYSANLLITLPVVLLSVAIIAWPVGALALRTSGIYFLMITLAFSQMLFGLAIKWTPVTGGTDGLAGVPRPIIGLGDLTWSFGTNFRFYYLVLFAFLLSWGLLQRLVSSPFGHTLRGIKENEERMAALGYDTQRFKVAAFVLSGVFAGLAGVLFSHFNFHVGPEVLYWPMSGQVLIMVIIGGAGTLTGPILGAALVRLLPSYVSTYTDRWQTIMGLVFMAFVLFAREGIISLWSRRDRMTR